MTTPTVLYRLYGEGGRLLYVGITCGPRDRFKTHHQEKSWWPEVVGATFEHFETRRAALVAESEAIRNEDPYYNVAGRDANETDLVRCAHRVRQWVACLPEDGADRYCDIADFLDAFNLYAAYDSCEEVRAAIDRMMNVLNRAFPTPGKRSLVR